MDLFIQRWSSCYGWLNGMHREKIPVTFAVRFAIFNGYPVQGVDDAGLEIAVKNRLTE
jgi:hypothetical protein